VARPHLRAHAVHEASSRARAPFVVFDCGAVPPNLVESELFGHERGLSRDRVELSTHGFGVRLPGPTVLRSSRDRRPNA
jgi:transcriptional regulator of aromatic amino acid metabolism